ncbi:hypothetical protein V475_05995 [Sphingobium baderi LL03]|uniref:Uncharacterized protein n=1 Tax=Sphingobium baderi LL03 TaxID=1114964 RepID=T0I3C7_9SPHN|nr:hypothetical protein L485_00515 [Sphingobium baderi LL03]KMS62802.1 hypothetical protein V475_05995 [Sphingobium baderi LL03]
MTCFRISILNEKPAGMFRQGQSIPTLRAATADATG